MKTSNYDELNNIREKQEEQFVLYLSQKTNTPYIKATDINLNISALQLLPEGVAKELNVAVFKKQGILISIAVKDPQNKNVLEKILHFEKEGYKVKKFIASTKTLNTFWKFYDDLKHSTASEEGKIYISDKELENILKITNTPQDAKKVLEKAFNSEGILTSKNIEYILGVANALKSSDIHIEAKDSGGLIKFRLDGVLIEIIVVDKATYKKILTRLKLVSGMKINTTKEAQDGSFVVNFTDRKIAIRASTIPEEVGESFVLRILDPKTIISDLDKIGLHNSILKVFNEEIEKPNGMIITTGPTGSGKTTTLYSFLNKVNSPKLKIITLEDPIEYRLDGIVQTQIEDNYTFAQGLRAILRQDPDVILVGEIRDAEVAETAINASLTGHLVFSTLHTNDAIGALPRLKQLGIDPKTMSRAINLIIAQRLVRKLCPKCSQVKKLTKEETQQINILIENLPETYQEKFDLNNLREPSEKSTNCKSCIDGYKGRIGIFEIIKITKEIEDVVVKNGGAYDIKNVAKAQGLPFMEQDGLWKALKGITSLNELKRVIGLKIV